MSFSFPSHLLSSPLLFSVPLIDVCPPILFSPPPIIRGSHTRYQVYRRLFYPLSHQGSCLALLPRQCLSLFFPRRHASYCAYDTHATAGALSSIPFILFVNKFTISDQSTAMGTRSFRVFSRKTTTAVLL